MLQPQLFPPEKKILLLDGHSLAFRAYYSLPDTIKSPSGQSLNVVHGFLGMLPGLLQTWPAGYLAVAFDVSDTDLVRSDRYPAYKATRNAGPVDLQGQVEVLWRLLDLLHIPYFTYPRWEADDILATLGRQAQSAEVQVGIVSGDRDILQLVAPDLVVLYSTRSIKDLAMMDVAAVQQKFGLEPRRLPDYKALVGDTSDNIPGVPGIGPRTAIRLLQEYETLENLYQHLEAIPERTRKLLVSHQEEVKLFHWLVTLKDDLDLRLDLESCRIGAQEFDVQGIQTIMAELGIKRLLPHLMKVLG